jgi:prepilin-type N-terminal cleavage/methylation domain-containing protein
MFKNIIVEKEDAFTIIELMVVAFIIGVLASVSVPIFTAQKKGAVKIAVVADVRNAAVAMEKAEIFSKDGYKSTLPDDFFASHTNIIEVLVDQSSSTYYCLMGTTSIHKDIFVYYNSSTRKLITEGTSDASQCGANGATASESYNPDKNPGGVAGETVTNPTPTTAPVIPNPVPTNPTNPVPTPTPTTSHGVSPSTAIPAPPGYDDPNRNKYDICHNGNMLSPALSGILNGHAGHSDDIIPPIPGAFFPGLNWDEVGSEIWYNGCDITVDVPIDPPVVVPTPTPTPTPTSTPTNPGPAKIPAPAGYNDPKAKKFAICHNGNMISPSLSGVINGHTGHDDDIIPPIPNAFPDGINWDAKGSAIWYAGCKGQK